MSLEKFPERLKIRYGERPEKSFTTEGNKATQGGQKHPPFAPIWRLFWHGMGWD